MYLDQNSGSILVQAIVGGAVGIGAIVKLYWFKLRTLGRRAEDASHRSDPRAADVRRIPHGRSSTGRAALAADGRVRR